jgi:hypothetical protein
MKLHEFTRKYKVTLWPGHHDSYYANVNIIETNGIPVVSSVVYTTAVMDNWEDVMSKAMHWIKEQGLKEMEAITDEKDN